MTTMGGDSSGSASDPQGGGGVPLIWCTDCSRSQVLRHILQKPWSFGDVFYCCPFYKRDGTSCPFWHWEEDYVKVVAPVGGNVDQGGGTRNRFGRGAMVPGGDFARFTEKRNKLLHDNMKDLVCVKFNSKLKQKKEDKIRDPIEKPVANVVLEDDQNEWLTGIVPNAEQGHEADQPGATSRAGTSQGAAATQSKRKKGVQLQHLRKRRKIVPVMEVEMKFSSSESEDNIDIPSLSAASEEDADKSISGSSDDEDIAAIGIL